MSLRAKTARGFAFESGKIALVMLFSTVKVSILARLLSPNAFGLLGLALALLTGLEVLTQIGSDKYLIQRKQVDHGLIGCAWLFGVFRATSICVATLLLAPLYGRLMHEPATVGILYIVAFVSLLRGLKSPGVILAQRDVNYLKLTSYETGAAFVEFVVVVTMAAVWKDAKALALGMMCATLADVVLSYAVFGFGFKFRVKWDGLRDLLGVGRHFFVIGVCSYVMISGDNLAVGALLGTTMLGYYVIAYKLVDLPLLLAFQVTNRVGFSALSRLQGNSQRMNRAFLELLDLQATLLFPLIAFIVLVPAPIVRSLYGPHWEQSIVVVRALGLIMLGRGMSNIVVPFLLARGDYRVISRVKFIETIVFLVGVLIGVKLAGLIGVALGGGCGYVFAAAMRIRYLSKVGGLYLESLLRQVTPVFGALAIPIALTLGSEPFMASAGPLVQLFGLAFVFFVSYAAITIFLRRKFTQRVRDTMAAFRRPVAAIPLSE